MDNTIIHNESTNEQDPRDKRDPPEEQAPHGWKEEAAHFLPGDLPALIICLGVVVGIISYFISHDPWLLVTFLTPFLKRYMFT